MSEDSILKKGFDHPCKQTCSGWEQGRQRGIFEEKERTEILLEKADAVAMNYEKCHQNPRNAPVIPWKYLNELIAALVGYKCLK